MSGFKLPDFNDRRSAAVTARKAALEKFKAKPGPGDPEFEKRQAERLQLAAEREARQEIARQEKVKRDAEAALRREAEAAEKKKADMAAYMAELAVQAETEAQQKVARDARYAARKAAKKAKKASG